MTNGDDMKKTKKKETKKLYLISLNYDGGELWLDENKQPLDWIHCNDAQWRDEYHNFIVEYLGGEIIDLHPKLTDEDYDRLAEADCVEMVWDVIKKRL